MISTRRTFSYYQMSTTLTASCCIAKTEQLGKYISFYLCVPTKYGLPMKISKSCDQHTPGVVLESKKRRNSSTCATINRSTYCRPRVYFCNTKCRPAPPHAKLLSTTPSNRHRTTQIIQQIDLRTTHYSGNVCAH